MFGSHFCHRLTEKAKKWKIVLIPNDENKIVDEC